MTAMDTGADRGKPKCGGPRKHDAGPCTRPAGWGTNHVGVGRCKLHGGRTPSHEKAGAQQLVEQEARRAFGRLSDVSVPIGDPLTELTKLAGNVVAWKDFLAGRIETLETLRFEDAKGSEQIRGELVLFGHALDRCNTVLATVAKLNIDERLARISERQADAVIAAIDAALDAAEVPRELRPAAKQAAASRLRVVA